MNQNILQVKTQTRISKPAHEVFEAIVDPRKMSGYFISSGTDRLESGKKVTWTWADVGSELSVEVQKVEKDRCVSFSWAASGSQALVEVELEPDVESATIVKVSESGWPTDAQGIARCVEQTQGWTHMLCCLKAYLEYGINLRIDGTVKKPQ